MKSKKVKLLIDQHHAKGSILSGSIYIFNEKTGFYEYKKNGVVISTVNDKAVDMFKHLFERI